MITEVYDTLGLDDRDHPAAGMFDTKELVDAACSAYGELPESDGELTWIAVADSEGELAGVSLHQWTGRTSALVHVSGPFHWLEATTQALQPIVVERDLMLYNPQARSVYNNRRQYPARPRAVAGGDGERREAHSPLLADARSCRDPRDAHA